MSDSHTLPSLPFECWATIAVSWQGVPILVSRPSQSLQRIGFCADSSFPDDDGWKNMPEQPGVWRCLLNVYNCFGETETEVVECHRISWHGNCDEIEPLPIGSLDDQTSPSTPPA